MKLVAVAECVGAALWRTTRTRSGSEILRFAIASLEGKGEEDRVFYATKKDIWKVLYKQY